MTTTEPTTEAPPRTKAKVLAEVRRTASRLAAIEARRDELYDRRLRLIHEARALDDRATQRELAEAAGVSETVIINALKKAPDAADA